MAADPDRQRTALGPDARIHDGQMHRAHRKALPGASQQIGGGADVARRDGVGDVHQGRVGRDPQDGGLDLGDIRIRGAEVGQQRDERHS